MATRAVRCAASLLLFLLFLTVNFQQYEAGRTLRGRPEGAVAGRLVRMESVVTGAGRRLSLYFQSLRSGMVPRSGPSGCTYIPGGGGSNCPVNEMHFAGYAFRHGRRPHGASEPRSNILIPVVGAVSTDHEK
ncbi:hypothetical protein SAY87_028257 [Trapa incisa]|uniref:Uncharacterized protein n=1 Tax=Trapa incisa TaxID=236973 RepID=A0AAN7QRF4_9MYRT|nr:hypothetical protein SAY87_028257 [Trapa incisa]